MQSQKKILFTVIILALAIALVCFMSLKKDNRHIQIVDSTETDVTQKITAAEVLDSEGSGSHVAAATSTDIFYSQLTQSEDYYALSLDLLTKAQSGDGRSQYHLALILLMCEGYTFFGERLQQDKLLYQASDIGGKDKEYMDILLDQYEKCGSFIGSDLTAFYDSPEPLSDIARKIYWFKQAYKNGILDASPMVFQGHIASDEFNNMSVKEQIDIANSLIKNIENQSPSSLIWLSSVSELDNAFMVYHAVSVDTFNLNPEIPVFNYLDNWFEWCMKLSYADNTLTDDETCGKEMMRYGVPLTAITRGNIAQLEDSVQQIKEALVKKDYRAAGLNVIIDILEQPKNE